MKIGCHLSSSGGYLAMGQTAVSIGANVFQFFTRNPRGGAAKPIDPEDVKAFLQFAAEQGIGPILAHAPYTLNAASAEEKTRLFAEQVFVDDLRRLEMTPGAIYNFHPGSHVGQGAERGIDLIVEILQKVYDAAPPAGWQTQILLETMAGKGSEVGRCFEELKAIIDKTETKLRQSEMVKFARMNSRFEGGLLGVCLDTCHIWDGGYDIVNQLDRTLDEFDKVIGLSRLKAIHLNDSMNGLGAHKDRHQQIGKGYLGIEAITRIINHPLIKDKPFYLETPCDLQGYKEEIEILRKLRK